MDSMLPNVTSSTHLSSEHPCCHWSASQVAIAALFTVTSIVLGTALRPSKFPGVKGPKPAFFIGNLWEFLSSGALKCLTTWGKAYGDVFKIRVGLKETLIIADPDLVKEVAVKKFKVFRNRPGPDELQKQTQYGIVLGRDKYWSTARGASFPWFHSRDHLESYLTVMAEVVDRMVDDISKVPEGGVIDLHDRLQMLTLDVFCCAAFGATLDDSTDTKASEISKNIAEATASLSVPTFSGVLALFVPIPVAKFVNWVLSYIPGTREWASRRNFKLREQIGLQLLQSRLKEEEAGGTRQDVLTQLLRAQAKAKDVDVSLTHRELVYVLGELILAGSDTTSNTIAFAVFLLSTNPEMEKRVLQEIDALRLEAPPTSIENLEKYKFVNLVVKETLRLYPIGSQLFREAMGDSVVGGLPIPKGSQIMFPLWLMHRNPKHFPQPDAFMPDRFDPACPLSQGNNMNAYLPFGDGPRMCLGAKFALQEAALALISLYTRFQFKMTGEVSNLQGADAVAKFPVETGVIMKPKDGMKVEVCRRA